MSVASDTSVRGIRWSKIVAEGTAIVVSILLAFAIQAWWDGINASRNEADVLLGLQSDFRATLNEATRVRLASEQDREAASRLLRMTGPRSAAASSGPDSLIASLIATEVFRPTEGTLTALLNSRGLGSIASRDLRLRLAEWAAVVTDVQRAVNERETLYLDHFLPYLRRRIPLLSLDEMLNPYGLSPSRFDLDRTNLLTDLEFENLVADLYFLANQTVLATVGAEDAATDILRLIALSLAR